MIESGAGVRVHINDPSPRLARIEVIPDANPSEDAMFDPKDFS